MYRIGIFILTVTSVLVESAPGQGEIEASGHHFRTRRQLVTFENGTIGVNFLGFKASAGLGGLLTGNWANGGLHAEAETPFGQRAGAGINGSTNPDGTNSGYLYSYKNNNVVARKFPF